MRLLRGRDLGLIPAHAGKTTPPPNAPGFPWAHPRSRGENLGGLVENGAGEGSSPLTRGKRRLRGRRAQRHRLIPAHAGKTLHAPQARSWCPAHPRSRGENSTASASLWRLLGSSPLTPEKLGASSWGQGWTGLIPAHAGKTGGRADRRQATRAHPRSRGENKDGAGKDLIRWGSSPLTRGKRRRPGARGQTWRLIPAHAGKTPRSGCQCPPRRAHPRSRGENYTTGTTAGIVHGSSPLTRGKR